MCRGKVSKRDCRQIGCEVLPSSGSSYYLDPNPSIFPHKNGHLSLQLHLFHLILRFKQQGLNYRISLLDTKYSFIRQLQLMPSEYDCMNKFLAILLKDQRIKVYRFSF